MRPTYIRLFGGGIDVCAVGYMRMCRNGWKPRNLWLKFGSTTLYSGRPFILG